MRNLNISVVPPRVAVLSARARASIAAETLQHGENETGGLLLGHRCGPVWYIVESVDPGPASVRETAYFVYDQNYLNHLINKLRWYYQKPLDLLGLWHRHPGSLDRFSSPDNATNRRFLADNPAGVLSALVNIDPAMRMTVFSVSDGRDRIIPFCSGNELFPPALLAYRASGGTASALNFLLRVLAGCESASAAEAPGETALEKLIELSEADLCFLKPLCGALTMKAGHDGSLQIFENGGLLMRLFEDASSVFLTAGGINCRYRAGLIIRSALNYYLQKKERLL